MKTHFTVALAMLTGIAIGGVATQSLHAQTKKAYTVTELEVLDAAGAAAFGPIAQAAQKAAGANPFRTGGGKIVAMDGTPPARVAIIEWNSLDQAQAFFNSAAWKDLAPQREKALKTVRRYTVEAN
jgi:uncharacterized protein (DUF1330 family)